MLCSVKGTFKSEHVQLYIHDYSHQHRGRHISLGDLRDYHLSKIAICWMKCLQRWATTLFMEHHVFKTC